MRIHDHENHARGPAPGGPGRIDRWVRENADALHQALFDAEVYRREHGLPRDGERGDFSRLAAELAALAGLDRDVPR